MIRLVILGDIGSGKTFVSKCFNFPIFNADKEVQKIYKKNKNCFKKLNKKFPHHVKKFPISKKELKRILKKKNIKIISKIVHPYVRLNLKKFIKKNSTRKFVVLDIPLYLENNLYKKNDILIYIKTPKKMIESRLKKRGFFNKNIHNILKSQQIGIDKKIKLSSFFIDNRYEKKNIIKQVKNIKKKLND